MHSVREFLEAAFASVDLDWKDYVTHDERFDRPSEVDQLLGDATKARTELGWEPKVDFMSLVNMMVESDLSMARSELAARNV